MVNRKTVSVFTIAVLLACAVPVKTIASSLIAPAIGQVTPSFPVPTAVDAETEVVISSGSDNMNAISQALRTGFEGEYAGSTVILNTKSAAEAIQDVLSGSADLAAISRPLTEAEKAEQGLIAVPVRREKIAIVVGKDNPFAQSLTSEQFAQIFRGEITDWSEVGGEAGAIRLIDRPADSDTRRALSPYPVFVTAPFEAADGATTIAEDTTEALIEALGTDGIGYVLVGELADQPQLKALPLHQTLPSDERYPFSQPYSFVYNGGASPEVAAFLGYATGESGQKLANEADVSGATPASNSASPSNETDTDAAEGDAAERSDGPTLDASNTLAGPDGEFGTADDINIAGPDGILGTADDTRIVGPDGEFGTADDIDITGPDGLLGTADDVNLAGPDGEFGTADDLEYGVAPSGDIGGLGNLASKGQWWWLLLPLAGLGLLIWAAGRRSGEETTAAVANRDDRIRSDYQGTNLDSGRGGAGLGSLDTNLSAGQGRSADLGLGTVAAGGAAIAGGVAAAGAGLKNKAGDTTMDLQESTSGAVNGGVDSVKSGIDSARGSTASGMDGLTGDMQSGDMQGGIDGARNNIQGKVASDTVNVQGSIDSTRSNIQGGIDGLKGNVQGGIDGTRNNIQSGVDSAKDEGSSWLDRAKQRINEATEQVKDTTADIKDDVMGKD